MKPVNREFNKEIDLAGRIVWFTAGLLCIQTWLRGGSDEAACSKASVVANLSLMAGTWSIGA